MTGTLPTILLTRPEAQSRALAERLRSRLGDGIPILVSPILEIVPLPFQLPVAPRFLVLTSAHAAEAAGRAGLAGRLAYCVGDRTAEAAEAAGLDARSAGGDASDLLALLFAERPAGPALYLRGRHVATDLEQALRSAGLDTYSVPAYDQQERPLSPNGRAALAGPAPLVLPVYSPRTSALLARECAGARAELDIVAISAAAATPWRERSKTVTLATTPDGPAMEDAVVARVRARCAC